jgi:hypothetical protein
MTVGTNEDETIQQSRDRCGPPCSAHSVQFGPQQLREICVAFFVTSAKRNADLA